MAERRMISKKITDTDAFLEMSLSAQALYFHFIQFADDEGFVGNPITIMRKIGANKNDYEQLIAKRFILTFESGICVVKHWYIHNYIRSDRFNDTTYLKEKQTLKIDTNKVYTEKKCHTTCHTNNLLDFSNKIEKDTMDSNENENVIPHVIPVVDVDKIRLDKISKVKNKLVNINYITNNDFPYYELKLKYLISKINNIDNFLDEFIETYEAYNYKNIDKFYFLKTCLEEYLKNEEQSNNIN